MDGCPYSIYEDGRDVKDYIIPPKGYTFKGFRFDPDANNQIYDGKLIAEYEKEAFNDILKSNLWKFLLALGIIAILTVVVILAINVFNKPKPVKTPEPTAVLNGTSKEKEIIQSTEIKNDTVFWTLIHERTITMDPYDFLYKDNKNKVEGEEYEYLRLTILKDFNSFKAWSGKLHKIPVSELESINTINDLKNKLHTIE